jgi:hypothetical protein
VVTVSFRRLIVCVTFLAVFTMAMRVSVDTDTWWHLRAGSWIVENGRILRSDPFSLTRQGQPWVYPGWLAQILLYGVYNTLGLAGLNLLTALTVALTFAFIWPLLEVPVLLRAFVLLLAATVSGVYWSARPQILSFLLTGLTIWTLEQARKGRRKWLFGLPPLMALWSNLHGGFAVGFILLLFYLIGEAGEVLREVLFRKAKLREAWSQRRSSLIVLCLVGLACALAVNINPHGPQMLLYPFKTISVGVLQDYIQEWQSPNFHRLEAQPYLWMVLLLLVALAFSRRSVHVVELVVVCGFAYMAFLAARNIALFALGAAPVLARHGFSAMEPLLQRVGTGRQIPKRLARLINVVILALMVVVAVVKIADPLSEEFNQRIVEQEMPAMAISHILGQQPEGPLFNSYNWGGYVLWTLYPDYLSFVDGRTDLFDDEILRDYLLAWRADTGWEEVIDEWEIRLAFLEPGAPLAKAMACAGWERLYIDSQAVVLRRPSAP